MATHDWIFIFASTTSNYLQRSLIDCCREAAAYHTDYAGTSTYYLIRHHH
jgi:hypothetical protein